MPAVCLCLYPSRAWSKVMRPQPGGRELHYHIRLPLAWSLHPTRHFSNTPSPGRPRCCWTPARASRSRLCSAERNAHHGLPTSIACNRICQWPAVLCPASWITYSCREPGLGLPHRSFVSKLGAASLHRDHSVYSRYAFIPALVVASRRQLLIPEHRIRAHPFFPPRP